MLLQWSALLMVGTCATVGTPAYNNSILNNYDMVGDWSRYFLNYPVSGSTTPKNYSVGTQLPFDRLDGDGVWFFKAMTPPDVRVPGYNDTSVFGQATLEFLGNNAQAWDANMLIEWSFRLVVPCNGDYLFRVEVDGMHPSSSLVSQLNISQTVSLSSGPRSQKPLNYLDRQL